MLFSFVQRERELGGIVSGFEFQFSTRFQTIFPRVCENVVIEKLLFR